jgi:signal transduction histidine kinase
LPPWYRTWWAYTLYALLFLGALRIFSKWRERNLRDEKEKLEIKVEERTNELMGTLENLKATQAQLIQSEKMASLGELTAGIAHEIQNPLNFVNNFSDVNKELLAEMKEEIDRGHTNEVKAIANDVIENEEKINHHGKRADSIVKGMLQHSRRSTGKKELTNINTLAEEYLRLAYHGLRAKDKSFNATLITDYDENAGAINIIPQDIGRVLLNIYNNAFYAVMEKKNTPLPPPAGGGVYEPTVFITTRKISSPLGAGGWTAGSASIEISIKDNGTGIPEKVVEKIFQPFFTTKPTGQGTGLGLSLSYDIIKAHGGTLKVETKENEYTEFIISLPVQIASDEKAN